MVQRISVFFFFNLFFCFWFLFVVFFDFLAFGWFVGLLGWVGDGVGGDWLGEGICWVGWKGREYFFGPLLNLRERFFFENVGLRFVGSSFFFLSEKVELI